MRQNSTVQQLTTTQLISTIHIATITFSNTTELIYHVLSSVRLLYNRAARARCARGTRCWLARGDSSPRPSPRALHIRALAAGFHCSCHSHTHTHTHTLSLSAGSLFLSAGPLTLRLSLRLSLSASLLAERLVSASVSASISSLASASARSSFGFIYNGSIWTTSNFSKSDSYSSVVLALV